jgi:hypothetical protein
MRAMQRCGEGGYSKNWGYKVGKKTLQVTVQVIKTSNVELSFQLSKLKSFPQKGNYLK